MYNLCVSNKKGIVLVTWYFVLAVLLGLSAVAFTRSTSNIRLAQRNNYSLQAFWEAEAGLSYAYVELSRQGFSWYTHEDKDTPVSSTTPSSVTDNANAIVNFVYPVPIDIAGTAICPTTDCYYVNDLNGNRRFQVKSYPERNDDVTSPNYGNFTSVVVVLSQATVNGVTRTLEYRLGQKSIYEYFFFFSDDHDFKAATFDGRNYGGIHVNGDINLAGWPDPKFYFLTKLTSGSKLSEKGFILRPRRSGFPDLHGDQVPYDSLVSNPRVLPEYLYAYSDSHFNIGNAYFRTGEYPQLGVPDQYTDTILQYYLDDNAYPGAAWDWDRYEGDGSDTTPAHYNISDQNLKNLALYEMCGHRENIGLLDDSNDSNHQITIPGFGTRGEQAMFEAMYNDPNLDQALWSEDFWPQWKDNYLDDYAKYHASGTLTGGNDWERRFFLAAYNWTDRTSSTDSDPNGIPDGINREWWEDLSYGDDRLSLTDGIEAPAQIEDYYTGEKLDSYILNTKEQPAAWTAWLEDHNLDEAGENQTLIQDRSQGGEYLDLGDVLSEQHTGEMAIKQKAQSGGIYIGLNSDGEFINPLAGACTQEAQFYNAHRPAAHYEQGQAYQPSNFLVFDVHALKEALEHPESELNQNYLQGTFNGMIYIDLEGYPWADPGNGGNDNGVMPVNDENGDGVMLVNGEILPEGGMSIVTPNNVVIKGNYNLDPDGYSEKNRDPDDPEVIARVTDPARPDYTAHYSRIDGAEYFIAEKDLKWQPADIISKRSVYTVSDDFSEPSYMPMAWSYSDQYYEEQYGHVPEQALLDLVAGDNNYPTNSWVPDVTSTRQAYSRVDLWFEHYYTGDVPTNWSVEWVDGVDGNWPIDDVFALDTDGDSEADIYMLGRDLRSDVMSHIGSAYSNTYSFEAIHGSDGSLNPYTPSLMKTLTKKHIYNMAPVTPYDASSDVLEYWRSANSGSTPRVINGAFIQLPAEFQDQLPGEAYRGRVCGPELGDTFNYESRFGRGAHASDRPPAGLVFGADSSWREIRAANF